MGLCTGSSGFIFCMRTLDSLELKTLLISKAHDIQEASGQLGWDYYDMWPVWIYAALRDKSVSVQANDSVIVARSFSRCWLVPLTSDLKSIGETVAKLASECELTLPLHIASWFNLTTSFVYPDYQTNTKTVVDMSKPTLKSRKQGIRRYTKQNFIVDTFELSLFNTYDCKQGVFDLLSTWDTQKKERSGDDANVQIYQDILSDPAFAEISNSRCVVVRAPAGAVVAFGLGTVLSNDRWSMIIRVADSTYPYLSDFLYNRTAALFTKYPVESDGHAFSSADDESPNVSLSWYKQRYSLPALTMFTAITQIQPVKDDLVTHE